LKKRTFVAGVAGAALGIALGSLPAQAQEQWPTKPVKIVVGFAPGGSTDNLARMIAKELTDKFKQSFVVENKTGANTVLAAQQVLSDPADGHTIAVFENTTLAIAPFVLKKQPYDPKQLLPVTKLVDIPMGLHVPADSPIRTLKEFVEYAKTHQNISFGSPGSHGAAYLAFEGFLSDAGLKMNHAPYRGAAPAVQDLVAGHIPFAAVDLASSIQHLQTGKVRALSITTPQRLAIVPNVPTYKEQGYPNQVNSPWFGVFAKAGTPRPIVDKLNAALVEIAQSAQFNEWASSRTLIVSPTKTPEDYAAIVNQNITEFSQTVKRLGLSAE
jgi:tripartite-type tricarboxylate transporter receptor subunit TctC